MTPKILSALLLLMLCGCATDVANRYYAAQHFPPKLVEQVQVLASAPKAPYDVIADLQCRDASARFLQKQAAKIGADAVIITTLGGYYDTGDVWAGQDTQRGSYSRIVGTAIRYKQASQP